MASLIQRAADKQRSAMYRLFDRYHTAVYPLVAALVTDEQAATDITVLTFEKAWGFLSPAMTEDAFADKLTVTAVELCKKHLLRQDAKAFRMPQDRRFAMTPGTKTEGVGLSPLWAVYGNFSTLQRTMLILHHVSGLSEEQQAAVWKLDLSTLHIAWDAEAHNITYILNNTGNADTSAEDLLKALHEDVASRTAPKEVRKRVEEHIRALAAPQEKAARLKMIKLTAVILVVTVVTLTLCWTAVLSLSGVEESSPTDVTGQKPSADTNGAAATVNDPTHYAEIAIKDHGTITVALDGNTAPKTVANFKKLADEHFYDSLSFHRIMEGFMMQGGDPNADGSGGSDETVVGEFAANGIENPLSHVRGAISMARADSYDSASSQFFIVHEDSVFLDGDYAAFGYVTDGMDIVDAICTSAQPLDDNGTIEIGDQPVIQSVTVFEAADYTSQ